MRLHPSRPHDGHAHGHPRTWRSARAGAAPSARQSGRVRLASPDPDVRTTRASPCRGLVAGARRRVRRAVPRSGDRDGSHQPVERAAPEQRERGGLRHGASLHLRGRLASRPRPRPATLPPPSPRVAPQQRVTPASPSSPFPAGFLRGRHLPDSTARASALPESTTEVRLMGSPQPASEETPRSTRRWPSACVAPSSPPTGHNRRRADPGARLAGALHATTNPGNPPLDPR